MTAETLANSCFEKQVYENEYFKQLINDLQKYASMIAKKNVGNLQLFNEKNFNHKGFTCLPPYILHEYNKYNKSIRYNGKK